MSKNFLIGQLACYGDCLYATTIAKQIKHDYSQSHITWAIASKYKTILDLNPFIDRIWEVNIIGDDYYNSGWNNFINEAIQRRKSGEFDVIIFSQIPPLNWIKFNGTIRGTILSSLRRQITVPVAPVILLSETEINNVRLFAAKYNLKQYNNVILFECNPGSGQSKITPALAIDIAKKMTEYNKDCCFILTTPSKIDLNNRQIIDASELTFRENAELTKYCTLLIGCSSGITCISSSDWAKKLPMLQLLDYKSEIYTGIHFDYELNRLDNSMVIEMIEFDYNTICKCIQSLLTEDFIKVKQEFHKEYKPNINHLYNITKYLVSKNFNLLKVLRFANSYLAFNKKHKNNLKVNYIDYFKKILAFNIKRKHPEIRYDNPLMNSFKYIFKKKLQYFK